METDRRDYHIDAKLERLFHADEPRFNIEDEDGDDTMAGSLPEWLIGVIVVIILLVIAFFIMVISTIVKNKRKNQSSINCIDKSSSDHACDDLELGKISMVDPRTPISSLQSEYIKDAIVNTGSNSNLAKEDAHLTPCCSTSVNDSPMCMYKNPLFIDDDSEPEQDAGVDFESHTEKEYPNTADTCCKSKGKSTKNKSSKNKTLNSLVSVLEIREDPKEITEESVTLSSESRKESVPSDNTTNSQFANNNNINTSSLPESDSQSYSRDYNSIQVSPHEQDAAHSSDQNEISLLANDNSERLDSTCNRIAATNSCDSNGVMPLQNEDHNLKPICHIENLPEICPLRNKGEVPNENDNLEDLTGNDKKQCLTSESLKENSEAATGDTGIQNETKNQRSSFIRMTLNNDVSELENNERSYTKL